MVSLIDKMLHLIVGQIALSPLYLLGLFQSPSLSIKPNNVPLYLLKMYNLPSTVYFSVKS
jgi:hypothetical protein